MTFTDVGLTELAKFLAGDTVTAPDYGEYGDGGTAPTSGDTALESAIASSYLVFSSTAKSDLSVMFEHLLDGSTSNGETLREFGIFRDSDSKLFIRITFVSLDKTAAIAYTRRITVYVRKALA